MTTPRDALRTLQLARDTGELDALCVDQDVELLVAHGSATDPRAPAPPRDLDLAARLGPHGDIVALINALLGWLRLDELDVMDLARAGVVARARALTPPCVALYERVPGDYARAQMAATSEAMETRWLRRRNLELMAGR